MTQKSGFLIVFILTGLAACSSSTSGDKAAAGSSSGEPGTGPDGGAPTTGNQTDGGTSSSSSGGPGTVTTPATPGWDYAKIGGGGFVTGGSVAADGTKFFRTDTSGGYLYDDAKGTFAQVIPRNIPASANNFWNGTGVFEAMIANSNSKVLYAAYVNALYKSTDGGNSFTAVKSDFTFDSNGGGMRTLERHGQIDPQNPDHVLFGDQVALLSPDRRRYDLGTKASGVADAASVGSDTKGFSGIAFNPEIRARERQYGRSHRVDSGGKFFHTTDGGADVDGRSPRAASTTSRSKATSTAKKAALFPCPRRRRAISGVTLGERHLARYPTPRIASIRRSSSIPTTAISIMANRAFASRVEESTDGGKTWDTANANWGTPIQSSVDDIPWHSTNPHYFLGESRPRYGEQDALDAGRQSRPRVDSARAHHRRREFDDGRHARQGHRKHVHQRHGRAGPGRRSCTPRCGTSRMPSSIAIMRYSPRS